MRNDYTSRREFIQLLGLGSTVLGIGGLTGIVFPRDVFADCDPPGNPGTPKSWGKDCRNIRPRRPASTLSSSEITKLRSAYQAMRDLDTSDPNDPRGFQQQANIHCWYCSEIAASLQVHWNWRFFAFHRAYLYFHERILGKLIGDMEFRLPYWDWDVSSHRKIPGAYTSPGNASNPLWNSTREMSMTDELEDEDVGEDVMEAALTAGTFDEFGGTATDSGIPEGAPHGNVHVAVGGGAGDMAFFETAGKDPIFYTHHANVDKVWSDWNKASSSHTNPTASAFLNLSWNFFDENKVWRKITAAQVLNHENQLRYIYGPSKFIEQLPCLLDWVVIRTDWKVTRKLRVTAAIRQNMDRALGQGGRVRMHITGLAVPQDKSAVYRLYSSADAARRDGGPGSDGYLGAFPVVVDRRGGGHNMAGTHKATRNIVVNVTRRKNESLLKAQDTPTQIFLVERGLKEANRKVTPVTAADVFFSAAGAEK